MYNLIVGKFKKKNAQNEAMQYLLLIKEESGKSQIAGELNTC